MSLVLPPRYVELVQDATLKAFWRKPALRAFLRRCGIVEKHLSTWAADETKRIFLDRTFPLLERSDKGVSAIHRMAQALCEQASFPDLEGWEDSATKKSNAKEAVEALRDYRVRAAAAAREERDKKETLSRVRAVQQEQRKRSDTLSTLNERLTELSRSIGTQTAGYSFQDWFYEVCDHFEVSNRRPYTTGGRQIDGSLTIAGTTYLVELKFTSKQIGPLEVGDFHKKVVSKADNTMGIMVSISGFSQVAVLEASGPRTPLLLMDYRHIYHLLGGTISLTELVERIRRHSSQTGEALLLPEDFGG